MLCIKRASFLFQTYNCSTILVNCKYRTDAVRWTLTLLYLAGEFLRLWLYVRSTWYDRIHSNIHFRVIFFPKKIYILKIVWHINNVIMRVIQDKLLAICNYSWIILYPRTNDKCFTTVLMNTVAKHPTYVNDMVGCTKSMAVQWQF